MSTLLLTLVLAFLIIAVAIGLMAIGWFITGRSRLQPGACGRDPTKKRNTECGTSSSCQICDKHEDTKKIS